MSYQPPGYMYVEGNVLSSVNFDIDIMPKRSNKSIIAGKDIFWLYEAISRYSCTNEDYSLRKIDATHGTISWD